jgi:hypothetical protein
MFGHLSALVRDIQNGHRMEKLEYSLNFFGEIMKSCWQKDPKERPTFSHLAVGRDDRKTHRLACRSAWII